MKQETIELLKQVEAIDDDKYNCNYDAKIIAKTILTLLPDECVKYAIFKVYGIGNEPTRQDYRIVNKFRNSPMASTLYYLLRGKDYKPSAVTAPVTHKGRHRNSPCITIKQGEVEVAISEVVTSEMPGIEATLW